MLYFFERLIIFILTSFVVLFVAPNFNLVGRPSFGWLAQAVPAVIMLLITYIVVFGLSELVLRAFHGNTISEGESARDGLIAVSYVLCSAIFLFFPRPESFSYGDNIARVIENGYLTSYGWKVQSKHFSRILLSALLFWIVCRIWKKRKLVSAENERPK